VALTVTSITPSTGHSGGQTLVEIVGTDFREPTTPAATGPTTEPPPSVRVTIGGREATAVAVVSPTLLYCLSPKGDPGAAVDVVVENLDDAGASLELATLPDAYTFVRPDLDVESELASVVRTLLRDLKRQVIENVVLSAHTDFDEETGDLLNLAFVAKKPALVLGNLEIPEDREHHVSTEVEVAAGDGRFIKRRAPVALDVSMTLVGVDDNPIRILNLMQAVRMYFKKNPWLVVDRDQTDASRGAVRYEMDWSFGGPVSVTHAQDNSNVESFAGRVIVRGVLIEDMPGLPTSKPAGIPAHLPHEATTGYGWVTHDDDRAIAVATQPKPEDTD
jgi:hypothetical protein